MVTADRARRPPRFGPEPWNEIAGETWSLWDLWFCVIAIIDHDGDIDALAAPSARTGRSGRARHDGAGGVPW